ncbi:hypothetical protein EIP86_001331 [Pleurotus ostreatoroseus]|nr:hypothetical protein EIP86_001331 [Pleurotus ostreatoroseus]
MQHSSENTQSDPKESTPTAGSGKDQEKPIRSRIGRFDKFFDLRTLSTTLRKTHSNKAERSKLGKKKAVLIVIREIDSRGRHQGTYVEIKSDQLFQILLNLHDGTEWWVESRVPPTVQPQIFYFSVLGLTERFHQEQAKLQEDRDESLISDLEVALQFIQEDYANTVHEVEMQKAEGRISFNLLWALIRPSSLVFRREPSVEQDQILRVRRVEYGSSSNGARYASIKCDVVRDDGDAFGLASEYLKIDEYTGLRKIHDLDVYPLDMHLESSTIIAQAVSQARRFIHVKQTLFETHGPAMREKENTAFETKIEKFFCAIFSPILLGFCFGSKTWGGFAAGRLLDIVWTEEAFNSLVLGTKQKELVLALTRQHIARSKTFDDIIPGKGRGLVGLLCGGPGCGKTLTAEATAEYTRSPLYAVSAGELGTQPEEVDIRLARALELAQRWNAVLLLDEAEVFLQARTGVRDLARNALVSIFLRQLEYYQGILILTTNLITFIDPAFESRIHFCIHYPDLGMEARLEIWYMFIRRALGEEGMKTISKEDFHKLSALEMNGRQIKNAVSSAQSIALEANVPMSIEHVNKVLEVISDWNFAMKQAQRKEREKQEKQPKRSYSLSGDGILIEGLLI